MFSRNLYRIPRTIGFRLTLWYSGIFIFGTVLLFAIAYMLLFSTLRQQDHDEILLRLKELSALYESGGLFAIEKGLSMEKKFGGKNPYLVRVSGPANETLFLTLPYQWTEYNINKLRELPPRENKWIDLPAIAGESTLEIASTATRDGFWLQVGKPDEGRTRVLTRFRKIFIGVMIPVLVIGLGSGALLALRAMKPIRNLIGTIRFIEAGHMDARVPSPRTGDDIDELIQLFNGMLEKIETLVRAMQQSLDMVAHDLRTPMTRLRGIAEMALRAGGDGELCREALADCIEESERILRMLDTLMDISEAETGAMKLELKRIDLSALAAEVADLYRYVAEEKKIAMDLQLLPELLVFADQNRLGQALANLMDNAVKYTNPGGRIRLETRRDGKEAVLSVSDTGSGIEPGDLPSIWDRLYRGDTSHAQKGLGLGLSLVKAVIRAHGGEIEVQSEPGKGSVFTIHLPGQADPQ